MLSRASVGGVAMSLAALAGSGTAHADDEVQIAREAPALTRVDVTNVATPSAPGFRADTTELTYRRWLSRGRADVGWGLVSLAVVERPNGMLAGRLSDASSPSASTPPMLLLGLRYRTTEQSAIYADATHVRGFDTEGGDRVVGKVGIEFKAAQSGWKIDYGGLGLRLAGDARMTLKLRRGGLGISMRSSF